MIPFAWSLSLNEWVYHFERVGSACKKETARIISTIAFDERLLANGTCRSPSLGPGCDVLDSASLALMVCCKHQRQGTPRRDGYVKEDGSVWIGVAAVNRNLDMV